MNTTLKDIISDIDVIPNDPDFFEGAYGTIIERINNSNDHGFEKFYLNYDDEEEFKLNVAQLINEDKTMVVPKFFGFIAKQDECLINIAELFI